MSDNPFLLPPGGAKPESHPERAAESVVPRDAGAGAPAAADPSHYIAVPASVESATHRIARPAQDGAAPPSAPAVDNAASDTAASDNAASDTPAEETRLAPPRRWSVVLPDGTRVDLDEPTLLGRDPAGIPDRPAARLLPVADSGKTVSKTHALFEPAPEGVRVRDLHSTNGIAIDTTAGRRLVSHGDEGVAPAGATVMLGSFPVRIEG